MAVDFLHTGRTMPPGLVSASSSFLRNAPASLLVAIALVTPAAAGQRVTLTSGGILETVAVRKEGRVIILSLQDGGEIGFPPTQIARIEQRLDPEAGPGELASPSPAAPVVPTVAAAPVEVHVSPWDPEPGVRALIQRVATTHSMDPKLLEAVVRVESNFDPWAVSRRGAMGLMQLMPKTAHRYGVEDVFDPAQNLAGGSRYLKDLLARFGEVRLALAAYNAGEEAVERSGGVPPYRETRLYVTRILKILQP